MKDSGNQVVHSSHKALIKMCIFTFLLIAMIRCTHGVPGEEISRITASMEAAWRSGDKGSVASFYSDDAYLIHPGGIAAHGRNEVNAYWSEFAAEPVNWKLTSFLITKNPEEIFELPSYKKGDREMKLWTDLDIRLPADPVFQYGQSELSYAQEGKTMTSTVEFILVWKRTSERWRIFIDTYH